MKRFFVLMNVLVAKVLGLDYAIGFGSQLRDFGNEIVVDNDGSAFVACSLYNLTFPGYHASVIGKINPSGRLEWLKALGNIDDSSSCTHRLRLVLSPTEDALYAAGYYSEGDIRGAKVYKLDKHGDPLWSVWLYNDRTSFYYAHFPLLGITADGDPVVMWSTGRPPSGSEYDLVFARLSGVDGSVIWYRVYDLFANDGSQDWYYPYWIGGSLTRPDGILLFYTPMSGSGTSGSGIIQIEPSSGDIINPTRIPSPVSSLNRFALDMDLAPDGDILSLWLVPRSPQSLAPETLYIAKTSLDWDFRWNKMHLGPDTVYGAYYTKPYMGIAATPDNGCVVAGTHSNMPYTSYTLISRFSSTGEALWHKTYSDNPSLYGYDFLTSVDVGPGGDVFVLGTMKPLASEDDCFFARLNPDGSTCIALDTSLVVSEAPPIVFYLWTMMEVTSIYDGHLFFSSVPPVVSNAFYFDTTICEPELTFSETPSKNDGNPQIFYFAGKLRVYLPNELMVSLALYDIQGRLVQNLHSGHLTRGDHSFSIDLKTKGIYVAVLKYPGGAKALSLIR